MKKLHISEAERKILDSILTGDYKILVFGSRIKGNHQKFSDLDLCLKGKTRLDWKELADLKEKFSNSNLPYTVDLIDYHHTSESFRKLLDKEAINYTDTY